MDSATPPKVMMDLAPSLRTPGFRLVDAGEVYTLFRSLFSVQAGIVARGTTQATALQLTAGVNTLTTVAAGNTGVALPPGLPGRRVVVVNLGAAGAIVYGYGAGDLLIPVASITTGASITQASGTSAEYLCIGKTFNPTVSTWKQLSLD
jgi:hypothetical protein